MDDTSLADQPLPERIAALISLSQFGRILPVHSIDPVTGVCTCGGFVKYKGKTTDRPCHAGKHPNLWKWQVLASSNPQQIAKWANKYPRGNCGIVTGEIMDVVDVDTKPTVDGMDSLRALEAEIGIDLMAIAIVVKTGNGIQLWFKHDPAGRLKTKAGIRPGIDIRGGHKGKSLGMVIAPGSRHPNGNIYQIVSGAEHGLPPIPEALIQALYYQQSNNSLSTVCVLGGGAAGETGAKGRGKVRAREDGAQRFVINPDAKLTAARRADLEILQCQRPKLRSTWSMTRANSPWPFKEGRNSPSEYEGSISCHLVCAGWSKQEIMDALCVWRRERGLPVPVYYSRYACTIGTAVAMITPRTLYAGARKDPPKGAWKQGHTRDHILSCIIETPRTPQQIADITGIDYSHVKVVIGRLRKDGMVIRDNHTYLCAPTAVPWYLQNIPEDAGEDSGEELITPEDAQVDLDALEAEYAAAVAAGMFEDSVEEEIEAPLGFAPAAAVYIKPTLPDFDDYVEPELVTVEPAPIEYPAYDERDFGTYASRAAALAEWEVHWKQENRDRLREFRKRPNYNSLAELKREAKAKKLAKGYAGRLLPTAVDLEFRRLMAMYRPPPDEDTNPF